jgi:hypothetical protein
MQETRGQRLICELIMYVWVRIEYSESKKFLFGVRINHSTSIFYPMCDLPYIVAAGGGAGGRWRLARKCADGEASGARPHGLMVDTGQQPGRRWQARGTRTECEHCPWTAGFFFAKWLDGIDVLYGFALSDGSEPASWPALIARLDLINHIF